MAQQARKPEILERNTIVDVDVHTSYRNPKVQELVAERMPEPHNRLLGAGSDYDNPYPSDSWPRTQGGKFISETVKVFEPESGIQEPLCNDLYVDHPVINQIAPLDLLQDPSRAVPEMRAANEVLVEHFLDGYDHFRGIISVTAKEPDKAAEEIDRMGSEDQVSGVLLLSVGNDKPLGNSRYDPIYRAAEDNDLAIVTHGTSGIYFAKEAPVLNWHMEQFFAQHALSHPWSQMLTVTSLVAQGVPAKFPDLDFVILESGICWVPFMMGRINREYRQRRSEAPLLEKSPEEYIRDQFYFSTQPLIELNDPTQVKQIIDILGADSIMFSTDHPHFDFDNPAAISRYFEDLTEEEQGKVLGGNAMEVFDI